MYKVLRGLDEIEWIKSPISIVDRFDGCPLNRWEAIDQDFVGKSLNRE